MCIKLLRSLLQQLFWQNSGLFSDACHAFILLEFLGRTFCWQNTFNLKSMAKVCIDVYYMYIV